MKFKSIIASIGIVAVVLGVAGGLGYWKWRGIQKGMSAGPPPEFPEFVRVEEATAGTFQRMMTAVGTVQAVRHIAVASEVSGKVAFVGFESGQGVDEAQVILRLDSSTEQADLRAAETQVRLNEITLNRLEQAMTGNAVSKQEMDRARSELDQSRSRVEQLKAMIDKKEIRAPFAGRMGMRDVHPGQYVAEGARLTTLQGSSDEVYVDFAVPQMQAAGLSIGSPVTIRIAGHDLPARIVAVDAQIDLMTRNARLRAALSSMGGRLVPGMFVDVRIALGEATAVVTAPPTAIRHAPFGDHLFVIEPDPKKPDDLRARQRFVKLGGAAGDRVIVLDGLKVGERVAADGSFKLREGALVKAAAERAPEAERKASSR